MLQLMRMNLQLKPLLQRKLWKQMRKQNLQDRRTKMYLLNQRWLKIRKQKDRRRRRILLKLWRMKQMLMLKRVKIVTKDPEISKKVAKIIKKLEAKLKRVDDKIKAYFICLGCNTTKFTAQTWVVT